MFKHLRLSLPIAGLAAIAAAGCLMLSGQFVVTYDFKEHGHDPLTIDTPNSVAGYFVDLKTIPAYRDHKKELKGITDLAVVGSVANLDNTSPADVEVWLVPKPAHGDSSVVTTAATVRATGVKIWGPLHLAPGETKEVGWNESSQLFVNKNVVMDQARGDGRFALYALDRNGYHFRISHAAIIAVIAARK